MTFESGNQSTKHDLTTQLTCTTTALTPVFGINTTKGKEINPQEKHEPQFFIILSN